MAVVFSGIMDKDKTSREPDAKWTNPSTPDKHGCFDHSGGVFDLLQSAKEAIGTVTGDKDLEAEGKADRRGGKPLGSGTVFGLVF